MNYNRYGEPVLLFHEEVFLPEWLITKAIKVQQMSKQYVLSQHIREDHSRENQDYKHAIDFEKVKQIAKQLETNPVRPFELEATKINNEFYLVTKLAVRVSYDDARDVSIVFRKNRIITAWLNYKDDVHHTLNISQYDTNLV